MKILLTGAFKYSSEQLTILEDLGYELYFWQDENKVLSIDVSNIEAVICNALFIHHDIKKFVNLKYIQLTSAGFDRVPIEYIRENDIQIYNAQNVYSVPIAEWVILKILEFYKSSNYFFENRKNKTWQKKRDLLELKGKTASIIGFGNIGKEVAKRLAAFDVKLLAIDVRPAEPLYGEVYFDVRDLQLALSQSDIVILTLPLTGESYHLINEKVLNDINDQAIIINVARGSIIDEKALIKELEKGRFGGVALDVFEKEPVQESSELWKFDNVSITPHNAFVSEKNNARLFDLIIKNLKSKRD